MSDVDNDRGFACVGAGVLWVIAVAPSSFCFKPRTSLKKSVYLKKKKKVREATAKVQGMNRG